MINRTGMLCVCFTEATKWFNQARNIYWSIHLLTSHDTNLPGDAPSPSFTVIRIRLNIIIGAIVLPDCTLTAHACCVNPMCFTCYSFRQSFPFNWVMIICGVFCRVVKPLLSMLKIPVEGNAIMLYQHSLG